MFLLGPLKVYANSMSSSYIYASNGTFVLRVPRLGCHMMHMMASKRRLYSMVRIGGGGLAQKTIRTGKVMSLRLKLPVCPLDASCWSSTCEIRALRCPMEAQRLSHGTTTSSNIKYAPLLLMSQMRKTAVLQSTTAFLDSCHRCPQRLFLFVGIDQFDLIR